MRRRRLLDSVVVPLMLVSALAMGPGCKSERGRIEDAYEATANGGRTAAANQLRQDWAKGRITFRQAINLAHAKLEAGDPLAVAFAGGVLDALLILEVAYRDPDMPEGVGRDEVIDWPVVGALAGKAGAIAAARDEIELAESLILGGTKRWQDDEYWEANDAHDALASTLLHKRGRSQEAVDRLRIRQRLGEQAQQALDTIEREWRRARGG
ncbi:MAG: hypothetical protein KF699_15300 [Phycisphaeraceae bacterium]|nr:hypothetical protein [Phycisphaeraceae bacterium]MBX3407325.1 hypothetical protein [Phycisphaeraceae bacterium]